MTLSSEVLADELALEQPESAGHALDRATVGTAATNIAMAAVSCVTGILAARLLGPQGRGELAAIQTWGSINIHLALLGTPEALIYFCARERKNASAYLASSSLVLMVAIVPIMSAIYFTMPWLLSAQSVRVVTSARIYLLLTPCFALVLLVLAILRSLGNFVRWNLFRGLMLMVWLVVLLVTWFTGNRRPEFVAFSYLLGISLLLVPMLAVVLPSVPGRLKVTLAKCKELVRFGLPCVSSSFPLTLNLQLDQLLMAGLLPARILGLYVAAVAWSGASTPLLHAVAAALGPRVAGASNTGRQARALAEGTRLASAVALVVCLVVMLATPIAMSLLFGPAFKEAIPAALVLVVAGAINGMNVTFEEALRGLGKPAAVMNAEWVGLAATALALGATLRPWGIMGAAFASVAGYSTVFAMLLYYARRYTGRSTLELIRPATDEFVYAIRHLLRSWRLIGGFES